ncbi:hypothetical protein THARTR1_09185 [Trichoderma harzianum]|uniref:Uncharacterized protein n=1 Tax=Trichoderma harzianum TaxID=5544 RepID=A0A2K0TXI2_TRIHA|nr:hypothetical protein THARTR1_09185 [Trichoderma harzianum]
MLCTIIAPELIMMAACANWLEARENHRQMQKYAEQDGVAWSLSHSYFANMGGFIVRGKPTQSQRHHDPYHLNGTCVYLLRKRGYITRLPNMTEAEIKDKSKGDMLAKLVALGQIVWSTVQIIARAVRRLPVSPLEVAVVAFAVSAVFIYGLYWNKPQRVGVAQTIQLTIANTPNEGAKSDRAASDETAEPIDVVTSEAVPVDDEGLISEEGTLPAEVYHLLESNGTDRAFKQMAIEMFGIESKALPGAPISVDSADMVGMFSLTAGVVGFGAAVFGAIHAVAWNFAFPSRVELILWRCASIYTAAAPLCTLLLGYVGDTLDFNNSFEEALGETIGNLLLGLCLLFMIVLPTILYILARLFIVVEMFRTLCFLPPESYVSTWTSNIPHIG